MIRISGAAAGAALARMAGRLPEPRRATLAWLRDPASGERLDRALILWFPGPRTATGEDLAELHIHGGRAVGDAVLGALGKIDRLRPAAPGEFTRRAFANGVIDLAQAEGLADLLAAETETQRRTALLAAGGDLGRQVELWRDELLVIAAMVEATLDFGDEDDVPTDEAPIHAAVRSLQASLAASLRAPPAERLRDGIRVVLAGPPNAGKSSLLNAIVGRNAAIVSAVAGTTRDVIEAPVALGGIAFLFSDTAGLRDSDDAVEAIGVARAEAAIAAADILLWLGGADAPDRPGVIRIVPKADIDPPAHADVAGLRVSAMTGEGIDRLVREIVARAATLLPRDGEVSINRRQRDGIESCDHALADAATQHDLLLVAEDLRRARVALDAVVGRAGVEDMLDALFGRFCIGK